MIQIKIPGTQNIFIINIKKLNISLQKELFNTFYPYAKYINRITDNKNLIIYIEIRKNCIIIDYYNQKSTTIEINSNINIYKKVYSIIRNNIQLKDNYCFLHGAAVSIKEEVCIFLASSGVGKSTLSVFLDSFPNNICLTDDILILNKKNNEVVPISKYIHIRTGSIRFLSSLLDHFKYNNFIERYEYKLSNDRFKKNYIAKHIFILQRKNNTNNIQISKKPVEAILYNSLLPYQFINNIISSTEINNSFMIYELYYDNLESLMNIISLHLEQV